MAKHIAIVGAGVSGLTTGIVFAEHGYNVSIFADEAGDRTTSAAAAAMWFPYDAEPTDKVIPWALETYKVLVELVRHRTDSPGRTAPMEGRAPSRPGPDDAGPSSSKDPSTGVLMIELRQYCRDREIEIPDWAHSLGACPAATALCAVSNRPQAGGYNFKSGFSLTVPLMDTTIYLDYLRARLTNAGGVIHSGVHLNALEEVDPRVDVVINCAGFGAKALLNDTDLEPHRGQVAIVPKIDNLKCAIVCDDAPLMYAIPRTNDCVFGGTNEVSDNRTVDSVATSRIVAECNRVLEINAPKILAEKVGLRPFRKSGVRLERAELRDGRTVIHNYGHGGAGFTLSWGCAKAVLDLVGRDSVEP
jgi:D-amino-acid oxidase